MRYEGNFDRKITHSAVLHGNGVNDTLKSRLPRCETTPSRNFSAFKPSTHAPGNG